MTTPTALSDDRPGNALLDPAQDPDPPQEPAPPGPYDPPVPFPANAPNAEAYVRILDRLTQEGPQKTCVRHFRHRFGQIVKMLKLGGITASKWNLTPSGFAILTLTRPAPPEAGGRTLGSKLVSPTLRAEGFLLVNDVTAHSGWGLSLRHEDGMLVGKMSLPLLSCSLAQWSTARVSDEPLPEEEVAHQDGMLRLIPEGQEAFVVLEDHRSLMVSDTECCWGATVFRLLDRFDPRGRMLLEAAGARSASPDSLKELGLRLGLPTTFRRELRPNVQPPSDLQAQLYEEGEAAATEALKGLVRSECVSLGHLGFFRQDGVFGEVWVHWDLGMARKSASYGFELKNEQRLYDRAQFSVPLYFSIDVMNPEVRAGYLRDITEDLRERLRVAMRGLSS